MIVSHVLLQPATVLRNLISLPQFCSPVSWGPAFWSIQHCGYSHFSPLGSTAQFCALAASMKLSVSFRLLDLGQTARLLGWVISSSQGLCYLPRVIVMMEKLVEWTALAGDTEVLGENLPRRHFVHHKSNLPDPGVNPGHHSGKPATNHLSYGAAMWVQPVL
jgi:hypothetical protein